MWERIGEIVRKEFLQTLRDPRRRALLFAPPLLQLIIFGFAVNLDVENTKLAWMDRDNTAESRALLDAFRGSRYFQIRSFVDREADVQEIIDRGDAQAVVRVLPGFARDIHRGSPTSVQILVDGTNSNTAAIISNYAAQVVNGYAARLLGEQVRSLALARGTPGPISLVSGGLSARGRVWFNADLKSRVYFVPGIVVNIIALVTIMLTAMAIVREREIGTMEQLMVTPIRPAELILGKLLPFALIGIFEVVLVTAAALVVFRVPFRGAALMLLAGSVLFLLTTLGVGLLISTVSHTQQQAMMASFFFFMPAMLLSGFAFPIRNMPPAVQYLTYLNPLRYFMVVARGVFLKGTGLSVLWPQMVALLVFGIAILGLSTLRFHKRLD